MDKIDINTILKRQDIYRKLNLLFLILIILKTCTL